MLHPRTRTREHPVEPIKAPVGWVNSVSQGLGRF
jgi:hypothetical protein